MYYEKKYKEALERGREFINQVGTHNLKVDSLLEQIFPELAEDKEERIMKAILSALRGGIGIEKYLEKFGTNYEEVENWLQKQGEQKFIDKVKPKFKKGDWVMLDRPVLITKVEDMPYNTHQYWTSYGTWFWDATKAKLWTIQDAKDGDVLVANKTIFIFKNIKHNMPYSYCGIDCTARFRNCINEGGKDGRNWKSSLQDIYPATKEQREILFKAMHEAGYEWDAEKKELKEIEQSCYHNDGLYYAIDILEKTLGKVEGYQSDDGILEHEAAIKAVKKLKDMKPAAWSEEDDKVIRDTCFWLGEYAGFIVVKNEDKAKKLFALADKLKHLKPQPRYE